MADPRGMTRTFSAGSAHDTASTDGEDDGEWVSALCIPLVTAFPPPPQGVLRRTKLGNWPILEDFCPTAIGWVDFQLPFCGQWLRLLAWLGY